MILFIINIKNNVNDPNILKNIKNKNSFPIPENISNPLIVNIIQMTTKIEIDERASMEEIKNYLEKNKNENRKLTN